MMTTKTEDSQRRQLSLYHTGTLKKLYPDLILLVIENNGWKSIVTEKSHPDCLWCLPFDGERHWYYHELKILTGKLDAGQKKWWAKFKETPTTKGIITKGLQAHYNAIDTWLQRFYPDHQFKII